jgi:hypothetical protein
MAEDLDFKFVCDVSRNANELLLFGVGQDENIALQLEMAIKVCNDYKTEFYNLKKIELNELQNKVLELLNNKYSIIN